MTLVSSIHPPKLELPCLNKPLKGLASLLSGSDWALVFQSSITATSMVLIIMNKCATFCHRQSYRDYMEFICAFVV